MEENWEKTGTRDILLHHDNKGLFKSKLNTVSWASIMQPWTCSKWLIAASNIITSIIKKLAFGKQNCRHAFLFTVYGLKLLLNFFNLTPQMLQPFCPHLRIYTSKQAFKRVCNLKCIFTHCVLRRIVAKLEEIGLFTGNVDNWRSWYLFVSLTKSRVSSHQQQRNPIRIYMHLFKNFITIF